MCTKQAGDTNQAQAQQPETTNKTKKAKPLICLNVLEVMSGITSCK
jgi:hypothetical protein